MNKINEFHLGYLKENLGEGTISSVNSLDILNETSIDSCGTITEVKSKIINGKPVYISTTHTSKKDDFYDFHLGHLVDKVREAKSMEKIQRNINHMGFVRLAIN